MIESYEGKRVAIYARVSTLRDDNNDLSIPDQVSACERSIDENRAIKIRTFSEAGSANFEERRALREVIALAESDDHPIDIILVHSQSRLFHNALDFVQHRERLRERKVRIASVTQTFGDNSASGMAARTLATFDPC